MNFVSWEFAALFLIVCSLYFFLNHRLQNLLLLAASYVFYGWWDYRFLGLIFLSSAIDFFCGLGVDRARHPDRPEKSRKAFLFLSVFSNLAILGFFKYYDFFIDNLLLLARTIGLDLHLTTLRIILPVGISFYTFQSMCYTIDIHRGKIPATNRFLDFLLYVSFFPQLVAGPIERADHLLPQVLSPRKDTLKNFYSGAQLAFIGFFKKLVIANNMGMLVDRIFALESPTGMETLIGVYAFSLQIYGDFSGYTDIARGLGRMLGFDIVLNFRLPFFSTSPSEFWQRWHISLSSWLRDYLYVSLGGNRHGTYKTLRNLAITMFLGGLWHGASWHFAVWGFYHGALLVIYRVYRIYVPYGPEGRPGLEPRNGLRFWISVAFFLQLTAIQWMLFRVTSMSQFWTMTVSLFHITTPTPTEITMGLTVLAFGLPLFFFQLYQYYRDKLEPWTEWPLWIKVPFYLALFYAIVIIGDFKQNAFIYFQF